MNWRFQSNIGSVTALKPEIAASIVLQLKLKL